MNTKQKLAHMVLGGILVAAGMIISPLNAQKDKFGEIDCTRLAIVDANGNERIILSTNIMDGIVGRSFDDNRRVRIIGDEDHGGEISAYSKEGEVHAWLTSRKDGGSVVALSEDRLSAVNLSTDEDGGFVYAWGKDGKSASFSISGHGGEVRVTNDHIPRAVLSVDEHGGFVAGYDRFGKIRSRLGLDDHGGHVQVNGRDKGTAVMSINQYGNGVVTTHDINGNR